MEVPDQLRMACMNGDILAVMDILEEAPQFDVDAEADRHRSFTPLMLACENADGAELVRLLVEELGANVNLRNGERQLSALHVACKAGCADSVEVLLDAGADVKLADAGDRTALHWAALGCPLRTVKSIVRRGGHELLSRQDGMGYTALMIASEHNRIAAARFLLKAGSPVLAENRLGHSAHELADWYGNREIMSMLCRGSAAEEGSADASHGDAGGRGRRDTTGEDEGYWPKERPGEEAEKNKH